MGGAGRRDVLDCLRLFQACDSTFPVGGFNHSYGMETYLREGRLTGAADFEAWLAAYLQTTFCHGEGLACVLTCRALAHGDLERVWGYDRTLCASVCAPEARRASRLVARQTMALVERVFGTTRELGRYRELVDAGALHGSPAVAFALFAHGRGFGARAAFAAFGYNVAATLVQNAVRAVPLGQAAGQVALARALDLLGGLWPRVATCDEGLLGASAPGLELAQMLHETQGVRLFMS